MAWVATAIVGTAIVGAVVNKRQQDAAKKDAKKEAKKERKRAREAEAFANTDGQGLGDLGIVDLSVDDDLDEAQRLRKKGRVNSTLSI